jgi:hypothetical protein
MAKYRKLAPLPLTSVLARLDTEPRSNRRGIDRNGERERESGWAKLGEGEMQRVDPIVYIKIAPEMHPRVDIFK